MEVDYASAEESEEVPVEELPSEKERTLVSCWKNK